MQKIDYTEQFRNNLIIRATIYIGILFLMFFCLKMLKKELVFLESEMSHVEDSISSLTMKLNDLKNDNQILSEAYDLYDSNNIYDENYYCKNYTKLSDHITFLQKKYAYIHDMKVTLDPVVSRFNQLHQKISYIANYNLEIELILFNLDNIMSLLEEILSMAPKYSFISQFELEHISHLTPQNIKIAMNSKDSNLIKIKFTLNIPSIIISK